MLTIANDRQLIKNTSFWVSEHAQQGNFFLSGDAGWLLLFDAKSGALCCLHSTAQMVMPSPAVTKQARSLLVYTRTGLQQKHSVRRVIAEDLW